MSEDAAPLMTELASFLDGNIEPSKATAALQLVACSPQGPRAATLSAGDIVAATSGSDSLASVPDRFYAALYEHSRTTAALRQSSAALLIAAGGGALLKIDLAPHPGETIHVAGMEHRLFELEVRDVTVDAVPYATVTSGITYQLNQADVLDVWRQKTTAIRSAYEH